MERTLPQTDSEQRFWQAVRNLERKRKFHIVDILENQQSLVPLLIEWFEHTAMPDARYTTAAKVRHQHIATKQYAIRMLWSCTEVYTWRRSISYDRQRRQEVQLFCVREAYLLGMADAEKYYKDVRTSLHRPTRIILMGLIPVWRITSRYR